MKIRLSWDDYEINELQTILSDLNKIRFDAVVKKSTVQMLNRARRPGGTPVDTGELRKSSHATDDEVGYSAEYAPHVEYGHVKAHNFKKELNSMTSGIKTVLGGYVQGQHFLRNNVERQTPIFREDLINAIEKELK